ncbi:Peptidyl-prolyl cis-trans isomerase-like 3 [Gracilariopsis chorda]|uniref:Peptidyl-prolyl cis-trans isomerase n=1 Tax=Gracilariopsis chorda TaxID=448386 RepID=A0A2V3INE6_9FLOR|nr:Peptidyl-prolyl cis-trans isomerase-like 3 [Gracilariopsis chorda]|eukprot:PXF43587.1 Peptidyl-prolyl cis-trans isomerase-like 3 [Gracilariopsis chorda]
MSVTLHTTKGDIKIELYCAHVPRSAANFLALCASHQFAAMPFHRVIPSFIIQAGDPSGSGTLSRAAFAKRLPDEIHPQLTFDKPGVVAYANSGRPSNKGVGSQFFITLAPASHLDATCTIVGHVIHGMSVVRHISSVPCERNTPIQPVVVQSLTIHANPFADGSIAYRTN